MCFKRLNNSISFYMFLCIFLSHICTFSFIQPIRSLHFFFLLLLQIILWNRTLQLVNKFPAIHGTRNLVYAFRTSHIKIQKLIPSNWSHLTHLCTYPLFYHKLAKQGLSNNSTCHHFLQLSLSLSTFLLRTKSE